MACSALSMMSAMDYRQLPDGVETQIAGTTVRLKVVGDKIVRVSAAPGNSLPADASLIAVPVKGATKFKVKEDKNSLTLSTSDLRAVIDGNTGAVSFYDKDGKAILAEKADGRKFEPITVEGTDGWTVTQSFLSPDDKEGLYGLGQHQANEYNYKGKNEELFQYNTKVSMPVIVSTGNYGILWDSYSLCRFGNPKDYSQLGEIFTLYDKDGNKDALTGTYTAADGTTLVRREPKIYFEHLIRGDLGHVVNLPRDFNFAGSHVVYEGELEAPETGVYDFIMYYSGYQTIFIGNKKVVDCRWRTAWNPNSYKFSVALEKGKKTPIRIEWEPNGSVAYCGLRAYAPVDDKTRKEMCWWGEMQDMVDYYFIHGDNMDEVISGIRTVTGKAPIMPKWVTGFWQSREKYNTQEEVLSTLAEFRKRQIPVDNIVIDWLHWEQDSWGSHEFDRKRFPDPKGMVDTIHAENARVMISVWPKFYATTEHFKEFDRNGWMYRLAIQDSIRDWVGPGYLGSFYDAYSPGARKLFWNQMADHYLPLGIDAWWMDASEPNIRDCTDIQYRKDLITPTALGPSTKYFNAYALMNAEAIYDGQRSVDPDRRVFLLTRSGFPGQQRYSTATWSGDIGTRWEDMEAQISAGLNFALCGVPWWSMDIGGFCVEDRYVAAQQLFNATGTENDDLKEWRELNTRWHQFGAFTPMYRSHGQWPTREVFNLAPEDHEAYKTIVAYDKLRYNLIPYIYSMAGMTYFDDYTLMRPLVMDFGSDLAVRDIKDQYMFGPAFLVAPVYHYGQRSRDVYFPEGTWYDFYTGKARQGGLTARIDAPYEQMPLFVRAGSIIPMGPDVQSTAEVSDKPITLAVYDGADGHFKLYEDEGTNYNYEKGLYSLIDIDYDDASDRLTISKRKGEYPGMKKNLRFNIVKIDKDNPVADPAHAEGKLVDYEGNELAIKL